MDDLFKKTIEKWGVAMQVTTAMEECGELISALNQYFFRDRLHKYDLAGEIADVEIVCLQLREMIGNDPVDEQKRKKIERLRIRLVNETRPRNINKL